MTTIKKEIEKNNKIRETIISKDDIINLIILLKTTKSVNEFLKEI